MNKFCSIFSQLLQLFPGRVQHMVKKNPAEWHAKGFTCWGNLSPCCLPIGAAPIPSERLPGVFEVAKGNWSIWASPLRATPRWPMPRTSSVGISNQEGVSPTLWSDVRVAGRREEDVSGSFKNIIESALDSPQSICVWRCLMGQFRRTKGAVKLFQSSSWITMATSLPLLSSLKGTVLQT